MKVKLQTSTSLQSTQSPHARLMDKVYRYQRGIYDLTRKYYLLGRDSILREMQPKPGSRILEVGCGTARNLILLAKLYPDVELFGIDASCEMLKTAEAKVIKRGLGDRITLSHALAEEYHHQDTFGLDDPFDSVLFSYSLTMIPSRKEAVLNALKNLKTGGTVYIVDFWDQADLPVWFQRMLKQWLAVFHVRFEAELIESLEMLNGNKIDELRIDPLYRRYAFKAKLVKKP